jgi:hypothetical protein
MNCRIEKYDGLRAIDELAQHFDPQLRSRLSALWENGIELGYAGLDWLGGLRSRAKNGGEKEDR